MTYRRPMDSEERRNIVEMLKRGNLSHREISRRVNRSQSKISTIAKEEGITPTYKRRRSSAVEGVEETFSKERRVATADKFLASLDELVSSGGLTLREAREVGQSLKVGLEARRAEDADVEGAVRATGTNLSSGAILNLAGCDDETAYLQVLAEMSEEDRRRVDGDGVYWDPVWSDPDDPEAGMGYPLKLAMGRDLYRELKQMGGDEDPFEERTEKERAERERELKERRLEYRESLGIVPTDTPYEPGEDPPESPLPPAPENAGSRPTYKVPVATPDWVYTSKTPNPYEEQRRKRRELGLGDYSYDYEGEYQGEGLA